jgi:hypothetical protein
MLCYCWARLGLGDWHSSTPAAVVPKQLLLVRFTSTGMPYLWDPVILSDSAVLMCCTCCVCAPAALLPVCPADAGLQGATRPVQPNLVSDTTTGRTT